MCELEIMAGIQQLKPTTKERMLPICEAAASARSSCGCGFDGSLSDARARNYLLCRIHSADNGSDACNRQI